MYKYVETKTIDNNIDKLEKYESDIDLQIDAEFNKCYETITKWTNEAYKESNSKIMNIIINYGKSRYLMKLTKKINKLYIRAIK